MPQGSIWGAIFGTYCGVLATGIFILVYFAALRTSTIVHDLALEASWSIHVGNASEPTKNL